MLRFFVLCSLAFWSCQNLYAAVPVCFNYETYEHPGAAGGNRALINYTYPMIVARNAAIPPLAPGIHQLEISKSRFLGAAPTPWGHLPLNLVGGALNYQEACFMTLERQAVAITVHFQHPAIINAIAVGAPLAFVAAAIGWPVPQLIQYLNRSLGGGGYLAELATTLYRFRNNAPPNFINLGLLGNADTVLIHIHQQMRVSKNAKELSHNSFANNPGYLSVKDIVDNQFAFFGAAAPDSATILSADFLQDD
jgi:hypothetical protein